MRPSYCSRCGSIRLRPSRRRSWQDYAFAAVGWRAYRCADCQFRFRRRRASMARHGRGKRLRRRLLIAAAALAALAAVLAAILYFGHMQTALWIPAWR